MGLTEEIKQTAILALQALGIHEYRYWTRRDWRKGLERGDGVGTDMNRQRNPQ